jgi:adenylate cyclase
MVHSLAQFNAEMESQGKKKISIGIGVNTGTVTVGNLGSDKKKNYTALGEQTQLTEDLQDMNKIF